MLCFSVRQTLKHRKESFFSELCIIKDFFISLFVNDLSNDGWGSVDVFGEVDEILVSWVWVAGVEGDEFFSEHEGFVCPLVCFSFLGVDFLIFVFDKVVVWSIDMQDKVSDFMKEDPPELADVFVFQ